MHFCFSLITVYPRTSRPSRWVNSTKRKALLSLINIYVAITINGRVKRFWAQPKGPNLRSARYEIVQKWKSRRWTEIGPIRQCSELSDTVVDDDGNSYYARYTKIMRSGKQLTLFVALLSGCDTSFDILPHNHRFESPENYPHSTPFRVRGCVAKCQNLYHYPMDAWPDSDGWTARNGVRMCYKINARLMF